MALNIMNRWRNITAIVHLLHSYPSLTHPIHLKTDITVTDFDKHRETLLSNDDRDEEGWESELRRYLGTVQRDIKKDVDVVKWW